MNTVIVFVILIVECIKYVVSTFIMVLKYASWPIMIVFIAVHYKGVFESVLKRATRLGWGNAEIEFREALNDLDDQVGGEYQNDTLIKADPEMAVISSFRELEMACEDKYSQIEDLILEKQPLAENKNYRRFHRPGAALLQLIPIFQKMNILSALDIEALSTLKRLRNSVAHTLVDVTEDDARRYSEQCRDLTKKIDEFDINDDNFDEIYKIIFQDERLSRFWRVN